MGKVTKYELDNCTDSRVIKNFPGGGGKGLKAGFADDTNLMKAINSWKEIKEELIPALKKVCSWLRCNKLSLNTVKTEFMLIGTQQKLERFDHDPAAAPYMISAGTDCEIKRMRIVKYLGLIVDDTLTWNGYVEYISTNIRRSIGILKRTSKFLKEGSLLMIYSSLIEPYLRYCNTVWGQCSETLKDKNSRLYKIKQLG